MSPSIPLHRRAALWARIQNFRSQLVMGNVWMGMGAAFIVGSVYLYFSQGSSTTTVSTKTVAVERRTILTSIKATGKVTFASEQTLKFNQKGTVARVNVKEGDRVKQGQVLAELDKSTVLADVRSAQLAVGASALQLKQLRADKEKSILDAENALADAERQYVQSQSDLLISKEKLPAELATAERTVQEREKALAQAQADLLKQKNTEIQNLATTTQSTLATAEDLLDSFYGILTNSAAARTSQRNHDIEVYNLLSNDAMQEQQTVYAFYDARNAAEAMRTKYGASISTITDPKTIMQALNDAHDVAAYVYTLGEKTYVMLQGATTDSTHFTVQDLAAVRTSVISHRNKASDLLTTIESAKNNLSAVSSDGGIPSVTLQAKVNAVNTAENALAQAKDSLTVLQTQNPADLQKLANTIEKLKADLASKRAALNSTLSSTDINIQLKQNDVAQKATQVQKASKTLLDYQLTAPFDGVVTHMDYKKGDNLLDTGDTESLTLQNPDFIIVTIPLDQVDVVHVKKDMQATIVFDAVPGQTFEGVIDTINSIPVQQSGVVSYNVEIKLPTPKDLTILSGMTATVQVETARKENVLAVPSLAIKRETGGKVTVQRADGTSATVEVGASDGRYIEVTSGLQEGDEVLALNVSLAKSSSSNNANAAQQMMRMGGAGGPPPGATGTTRN